MRTSHNENPVSESKMEELWTDERETLLTYFQESTDDGPSLCSLGSLRESEMESVWRGWGSPEGLGRGSVASTPTQPRVCSRLLISVYFSLL